jgi:hypothetical protein
MFVATAGLLAHDSQVLWQTAQPVPRLVQFCHCCVVLCEYADGSFSNYVEL